VTTLAFVLVAAGLVFYLTLTEADEE